MDCEGVSDNGKVYNIRHRCFYFSKALIDFIKNSEYERIWSPIFSQLLRSGTSIGANVVEGGGGSTSKDFVNFFHIALKSARETKYWLCLIRDTMNCDREKVKRLLREAEELSKIIATIILRNKRG